MRLVHYRQIAQAARLDIVQGRVRGDALAENIQRLATIGRGGQGRAALDTAKRQP